jgi:hypothetical protein
MQRLGSLSIALFVGFLTASPAAAQEASDCLECHSDPGLKNDAGRSLFVDIRKFNGSKHGQAGIACVDCHADLAGIKDYPHASPLPPANCVACHQDIENVYYASPHGKLLRQGRKDAPACLSCHGEAHSMVSDTKAKEACLNCHKPVGEMLISSAHGGAASACVECHGRADARIDITNRLTPTTLGHMERLAPRVRQRRPIASVVMAAHTASPVRRMPKQPARIVMKAGPSKLPPPFMAPPLPKATARRMSVINAIPVIRSTSREAATAPPAAAAMKRLRRTTSTPFMAMRWPKALMTLPIAPAATEIIAFWRRIIRNP